MNRVLPIVLTLAAAAAPAQAPSRLVGGASTTAGGILQRDPMTCTPAQMCGPLFGPLPQPFAGGTAYDPIRGVIWTTDGVSLIGMPAQNAACVPVCGPIPVPGLAAGVVATALAFQEDGSATGVLWCVDSSHNLHRFAWSGACPVAGTTCSLATSAPTLTHRFGGLAISETNSRIFYAASDFGSGLPNTWVFSAPLSNPCTPTCSVPLPLTCPGLVGRRVTGLAFDDCLDTLYVTDGIFVFWAAFTAPCTFGPMSCCTVPAASPYVGLCVEPRRSLTQGSSCLSAPCATCPSMLLAAVGDPTLGNSSFGFRLANAPAGSTVLGYWNVGCSPGVPALCGTFFPPFVPPPIPFTPVVLGGTGCGGQTFHALPIPLAATLCGLTFSAQDVLICPGFGTGLSNAVCATISDT
jgi:hypothetical protein